MDTIKVVDAAFWISIALWALLSLLVVGFSPALGCSSGQQPQGPAFALEEAGGSGFATVRLWGQRLRFETLHAALDDGSGSGEIVYCPVFSLRLGEPGAYVVEIEGALPNSAEVCYREFGRLPEPFLPRSSGP